MIAFIVILTTVFFAFYVKKFIDINSDSNADLSDKINEAATEMGLLDHYGLPLLQSCINVGYNLYRRLFTVHVAIFLLKFVPTGLYMYKLMKSIYTNSRERLNKKQLELEDIQLQIEIVNTKLCVRDAEFKERAEQLRRSGERLRVLRARVRGAIAANEPLRRALAEEPFQIHIPDDPHTDTDLLPPAEDQDFIVELLKELKYSELMAAEMPSEKMECGEPSQTEANNDAGNSVYSSLSDSDVKKDCQVKIVKVTNVYKVAYLKHYIKQKRLRRATKNALLKKKMESIKKMLEEWQNSLNMVINSKLSMLKIHTDSHGDVTSQEAMGDYSKPLQDFSDSDTDLKNSNPDTGFDEYSLSWMQNHYKNFTYNYDNTPEAISPTGVYQTQEYGEVKYSNHSIPRQCECNGSQGLFMLPEETSSQVAIEEIRSEAGEECYSQDIMPL